MTADVSTIDFRLSNGKREFVLAINDGEQWCDNNHEKLLSSPPVRIRTVNPSILRRSFRL